MKNDKTNKGIEKHKDKKIIKEYLGESHPFPFSKPESSSNGNPNADSNSNGNSKPINSNPINSNPLKPQDSRKEENSIVQKKDKEGG